MKSRSLVALVMTALLSSLAAPVSAQLTRSYPGGVHQYIVNGAFQGEAMNPWDATLEVRDTTLNGEPAIRVMSVSTRNDPPGRFTYSTILKRASLSAVGAQWVNDGQAPSGCTLSVAGNRITGKLDAGDVPAPVDVTGAAIPDFAVGAALALRRLADGDTIRLTAFRCLPQWNAKAIVTKPFVAVVKSIDAPRATGQPAEPVWQIEGLEPYRMAARIAKRDRQLLSFTIPEGSVGHQTQTFTKTTPK